MTRGVFVRSLLVLKHRRLTLFAFTVILLATAFAHGATYFVSITGSDTNSGLNPADAWRHIAFATTQVSPGDTVFIERGDYGDENVEFTVDGTAGAPIVFAGYQFTPGDRPEPPFVYGNNLDPAVMPLLDGVDRSVGIAVSLHSRQYVVLKNLQIRNYEVGIYGWHAQQVVLENIVVKDVGDIDAEYSGVGIKVSGADDNTILDCFVVNAAAEAISVYGNSNRVENCRVYADDNSTLYKSATDYYIFVGGDNNIVDGCYAERVGDLDHAGHGIGLKGDCENNRFSNCSARNLSGAFYVRHRGSRYNLFENCTAIENIGLLVRDGASHNTFVNCRTVDANSAVAFKDTGEDGGAQYAGRHNVFANCIFENTVDHVIDFHYYDRDSSADNNRFVNCVVSGGAYLFKTERTNFDNEMVNSIVTGVQDFTTGPYALDFDFSHSAFWDCGFATPTGAGMLTADPLLVDRLNGDFHLTWTSPCRDGGDNSAVVDPEDFEGDPRIALGDVDMGADEFWYHLYPTGAVKPGGAIDVKIAGQPGKPVLLGSPRSAAVDAVRRSLPRAAPRGIVVAAEYPGEWYSDRSRHRAPVVEFGGGVSFPGSRGTARQSEQRAHQPDDTRGEIGRGPSPALYKGVSPCVSGEHYSSSPVSSASSVRFRGLNPQPAPPVPWPSRAPTVSTAPGWERGSNSRASTLTMSSSAIR